VFAVRSSIKELGFTGRLRPVHVHNIDRSLTEYQPRGTMLHRAYNRNRFNKLSNSLPHILLAFFYATADEAEAYMFYRCFFCFFFVFSVRHKNTRQPFSGTAERIIMKLLSNDSGESVVSNVVPPPGAWRMLICIIYADSAAGYGNPNTQLCTLWLWWNHQRAPRTAVAL